VNNDLAAALRAQAFVTNLKGTVRVFTEASRLNEVQLPPSTAAPSKTSWST